MNLVLEHIKFIPEVSVCVFKDRFCHGGELHGAIPSVMDWQNTSLIGFIHSGDNMI